MKKEKTVDNKYVWICFIILLIVYLISSSYRPILSGIFILWTLFSLIYISRDYNKDLKSIKEYEYYRDIDFRNVNAVASGILLKTEKVNINTVITAIYELAEKNIIEITWKEQKNYLKLKVHDKENLKNLLPYEQSILHFLFTSPNDVNECCLEDILNKAKLDSTTNYLLKDIESQIRQHINTTYFCSNTDFFYKKPGHFFVKLGSIVYIYVFIFGWLSLLGLLSTDLTWLSILFIAEYLMSIFIVIYVSKSKFLKEEYRDEIQKLYGLYAYMSDYSLLHEQELKFYHLYNKYFVYAIGLGIADKFEKELGQDKLNNEVRTALQFYIQNRRDI